MKGPLLAVAATMCVAALLYQLHGSFWETVNTPLPPVSVGAVAAPEPAPPPTPAAVASPAPAVDRARAEADARFQSGVALQEDAKYDAALAELTRATELAPDHVEAWWRLHEIYATTQRHPEGLAALDRVEALTPNTGRVAFARAFHLSFMADKTRMLAELKRACDLGFSRGCESYEQERTRR